MEAAKILDITGTTKIKMSAQDYHAHPALGSTSLKRILRSPAHYMEQKLNPTEPTAAMLFGTAVHTAVLEPELFSKTYAPMLDFGDQRKTENKAKKAEWAEANLGKTHISKEDYLRIGGILDSLVKHGSASKLLSSGHAEESFFWQEIEAGITCKCRPDFLRDGNIIVDLKTTSDASFNSFQRQISNLQYHLQAAFYLDGVSRVLNHKFDKFVIVAVETQAPYAVACYALDDMAIESGRIMYQYAMNRYAECTASNTWPAYKNEIIPMNLPAWSLNGVFGE